MDLQTISKLLATVPGRQKLIRASCCGLMIINYRLEANSELKAKFGGLIKNLRQCALVMRRFGDIDILIGILALTNRWQNTQKMDTDLALATTSTVLSTLYHYQEHAAFLADSKFFGLNSEKCWRYCAWTFAGVVGVAIVGSVRAFLQNRNKRIEENGNEKCSLSQGEQRHLLGISGLICDFIVAVNALPKNHLWSQTLNMGQIGFLGLTSSVIGLNAMLHRMKT